MPTRVKSALQVELNETHEKQVDLKEKPVEKNNGIGIENFLHGKVMFIAGATGFFAKVLIEKILRTMPGISKIYLMIRAKDKEDAKQRLKNEIVDVELFKFLKQKYGEHYEAFMYSKLVPVVGNVGTSNLGMEEDLASEIAKEVQIIVNSAGDIVFDQRAREFGWRNTYGFTKALGEMLIDQMRGEIPIVIIRPSGILSTYKEPFPGWIEGIK
ncbi:Male sterility, NAD-binding protein [Corchorus olitorius]|uniref:Fatty acyl-CoA reductase n=1 Tax=Corchorus olitorius TaxID=93759 RepID=A0A1R3HEX8_9ROSI|nr:Male sterility, NAD-binding protein [Corchorus olitorius]